MSATRPYVVTLSVRAVMKVWVEADSSSNARLAALGGDYDTMTPWEPDDNGVVIVRRVERTERMPEVDYGEGGI